MDEEGDEDEKEEEEEKEDGDEEEEEDDEDDEDDEDVDEAERDAPLHVSASARTNGETGNRTVAAPSRRAAMLIQNW